MTKKVKFWWQKLKRKDQVIVYAVLSALSTIAFALIAPIYALFLNKNGLSASQMTTINTVYMLSVFLLEIPTGVIADAFGRKTSTIIGWLFQGLGFFIYSQANSFGGFAMGEFTVAIGSACISGALSAWLREVTDDEGYLKVISKTRVITQFLAITLNSIAAWVAVNHGYDFIWFAGGSCLLSTAILGIFLMVKDNPGHRQGVEKKGLEKLIDVLRTSKQTILESKVLKLLFIANFLTYIGYQALNMFWALRFTRLFDSEEIAGPIFSGISFMLLIGSWLTQSKILRKRSHSSNLLIAILFVGISILLSAVIQTPFIALIFFWLHEVGRGAIKLIQEAYIQKHLPESARAALSSLGSMSSTLGATVGLTIAGQVASRHSITAAWIISAVLFMSTIPIYLSIKRQDGGGGIGT